jgi:hypothetical protein
MNIKLIGHSLMSIGITAFAGSVILGNQTFGLDTYSMVYVFLTYLMFQGLQFNLHGVSTITDSAVDLLVSVIPLFMAFYIYTQGVTGADKVFLSIVFTFVAVFDFLVIGWASLKLLLYTDKNG